MKTFQTIALLAGAIGLASAAATPGAPVKRFELNGNTYNGEANLKAARDLGTIMEKRCVPSAGVTVNEGEACNPGDCACLGDSGCYGCNGGPPICQHIDGAGNPTTCYQ